MDDAAQAAQAAAEAAEASGEAAEAAGEAAEAAAEAKQPPTPLEQATTAQVAVATAGAAAALANETAAAAELDAAERTRQIIAGLETWQTEVSGRISSLEANHQELATALPSLAERLSSIQAMLTERAQPEAEAVVNAEGAEAPVTVTVQSGEEESQEAKTAARHRFL